MIVSQTEVIDVPASLATVLQDREVSSYQRTFFFRNLSDSTITLVIHESDDGGNSWDTVDTSFTLGPAGAGEDVEVKNVTSSNILRVQASGGGADRDLYLGLVRIYLDSTKVWTRPTL